MNIGDGIEVTGGPLTHASWIGKRGAVVDIDTSSFGDTWVTCDMGTDYGKIEFRSTSVKVVWVAVHLYGDTEDTEWGEVSA